MKRFLLCLLFVFSATAFAGGTTGGGGNVQLPDQVPDAELIASVVRAKEMVLANLNGLSMRWKKRDPKKECSEELPCDLRGKIFDGPTNIFDVFRNLEVETKLDGPCFDASGLPFDGSAHGAKPGTLCVSIHNLREKLRKDIYDEQIAALLLHEASHLIGTTEEEADQLQRWILSNLRSQQFGYDRAQWMRRWLENSIPEVSVLLKKWGADVKTWSKLRGKCAETGHRASYPTGELYRYASVDLPYPEFMQVNHFLPDLHALFWTTRMKLAALTTSICARDPVEKKVDRDRNAQRYAKAFGKNREIPASQYGDPFYAGWASPSVMIRKITDQKTLRLEAEEAVTLFLELERRFFAEAPLRTYTTTD